MSEPAVLVERDGHIVTVTLNRPEKRNAFNSEVLCRLCDAWDLIDGDPDIRVAILTGAGGDFSAGADLKEYRTVKPLVAAVEGYCYAGGLEILQATDIRVAAEGAKIGLTEVQRSLFPMAGTTVRLPRQIPWTKAMEIMLIGDPITGTEAERLGLVGHVVPDGQALTRARELAEKIAANGPLAVQGIKASVLAADALPEAEAYAKEAEIGMRVMASNDAKEGPKAFLEKRPANFTGT